MRICPTCFGLYGPDTALCPKDNTPTENHTDVLIGRQLGPYVARSLIGEGGMGVVYAGEHPTLGKRVALKVLRPELSLRDDIVERFIQEARAVNTIGHANIVNIYDFGRTPFGSFYFVMEYLDGQTIRTIIEAEAGQPLERVRMVVTGVGAALAAAHAKGFIHRDVKPENIMLVNRAGQEGIKLLDFGIVKLLNADRGRTTMTGGAMGTPQYMCPEQLEDRPVDHRADIYALGVVTYEMLTGGVPYPGKSQAEVRQLQLTRMPAPPSVCRTQSRLSRALDAAVLWAISIDPAARPRSVEDFIGAFQTGYERTLVEQSHGYSDEPRPRRRTILAVGLTLGAILVGGGASLLARHLTRPDAKPGSGSGSGTGVTPPPLDPAHAAVEARQALLAALESPRTRQLAVETIGESGRPLLLPELRKVLEDEGRKVREDASDAEPELVKAAARTLATLRDKAAIPIIRKAMEQDEGSIRLYLARALAVLGDARARRIIREQATRPTTKQGQLVQRRALEFLAELGDPAAVPGIKQRMEGTFVGRDPALVRRSLGQLAACGDEESRSKLREHLEDPSWMARVEAAEALGARDEEARSVLAAALAAPDPPARYKAALALAHFGDERGRDTLIESLRSTDEAGRRVAILALGRMKSAPAIRDALMQGRRDRSASVALAAAAALAVP